MGLSPQSESVVQQLLSGAAVQTGKISIAPLSPDAKEVLRILTGHSEVLSTIKGEEQARKLRQLFAGATGNGPTVREAAASSTLRCCIALDPPAWRLQKLRCHSIRGIAPINEVFEFDFYGKSNLIYGPNGSGKSSLMAAVTWVVTGKTVFDCAEPKEEATIYKPIAGTKIRDWPIIATLPGEGDVAKASHDCWGEVTLLSPESHLELRLRRRHGEALEASLDGVDWMNVLELSHYGIEALDVQLSLIAPTIFGRRAVEEADDTRSILSLILGFDDLEQLGALASTLSGNRTRLVKSETLFLSSQEANLKTKVQNILAHLPEGTAEHGVVVELVQLPQFTVASFESTKEKLDAAATAAELHLAAALGLTLNDGKPPSGLADRLTVAVDFLGKPFEAVFPSFAAARLQAVLPSTAEIDSKERLAIVSRDFDALTKNFETEIRERYEWWQEESAPGSQAGLLLKAASFFDSTSGECPVCNVPIADAQLTERLDFLKKADKTLGIELRTFFADLVSRLSEVVTPAIVNAASRSIQSRIDSDWTKIRDEFLGASFTSLSKEYDSNVEGVKSAITLTVVPTPEVLPPNCDAAFTDAASNFVIALQKAQKSLALLKWSLSEWDSTKALLAAAITHASDPPTSLYANLSRSKGAALLVKPLSVASREMHEALEAHKKIEELRQRLRQLDVLEHPLDQMKLLAKYAEGAVRSEFDAIKDKTSENLRWLYPESSTGMTPGKLKLGTGKNKTVEALMTTSTYEVAGQYFANAGLQRAVALAFYFALLEKHRGGLGFIIMDDPILSLDEDHRERWSAHILKPKITTLQVILATHQRQFLNSCAQDFASERSVELNPREHFRRISWKPGDRLKRAVYQLNELGEWLSAATTMRKYREDLLISLDAYCPESFFDSKNLADSLKSFEKQPNHSPLSRDCIKKVSETVRQPSVSCVLDPASHSLTESEVTVSMVADCLKALLVLEKVVNIELSRLDRVRERSLRGLAIEAAIVPFPQLTPCVSWRTPISLRLIGSAAARTDGRTVQFTDDDSQVSFPSGSAVQVASDSFEPLAYVGQWVLLADEGTTLQDGDLVAIQDNHDSRYLRRIWSAGRTWILQAINPVRPSPSITIAKRLAAVRKVIGVLHTPLGTARPKPSQQMEWLPCGSLDSVTSLGSCRAISVIGDSLNPIARNGQKVLVDDRLPNPTDCPEGALAVVEFEDEENGNVVKHVFPGNKQWILQSPNPTDRIPPIVADIKEIRAVWIVRGVLYETTTT